MRQGVKCALFMGSFEVEIFWNKNISRLHFSSEWSLNLVHCEMISKRPWVSVGESPLNWHFVKSNIHFVKRKGELSRKRVAKMRYCARSHAIVLCIFSKFTGVRRRSVAVRGPLHPQIRPSSHREIYTRDNRASPAALLNLRLRLFQHQFYY